MTVLTGNYGGDKLIAEGVYRAIHPHCGWHVYKSMRDCHSSGRPSSACAVVQETRWRPFRILSHKRDPDPTSRGHDVCDGHYLNTEA